MRRYRSSAVCAVTGLKPMTLLQWHLRGAFQPSNTGSEESEREHQKWRSYSLDDVVSIEVIRRLTEMGLTLDRSAKIVAHGNGIYVTTALNHQTYLVIASPGPEVFSPAADCFHASSWREAQDRLTGRGSSCAVILDLTKVARSVKAELEELSD